MAADLRGGLADELLVDAADDHLGRLRDLELDPVGGLQLIGWENPSDSSSALPCALRAVADALDLQSLLEAVGDALDHVRDQAAGQAVQGAVLAAIGRAGDGQDAVVDLDLHVAVERPG